jgi:Ni2+-binding GTPase involved in maturation of urease and hydrogenase
MDKVEWTKPRELTARKPVRVIMINGFLGAGKTTAMAALARCFAGRGLKTAFVTNDQAASLVDSASLRSFGSPVGEVAGGCFCCRFSDLVDSIRAVLESEPDVVLCESVGSCTDLAATVINPLRLFYREILTLAPFTVVADPQRAKECVLGEAEPTFPEEVAYIYRKQLEEADLIALGKVDTIPTDEAVRIGRSLDQRFGRPVLRCSPLRGDGIADWADRLLSAAPSGSHLLADIDYDTYARGEAALGWLNMTVEVTGAPTFEPLSLAREVIEEMRSSCAGSAEIAHLKVAIGSGAGYTRANLAGTDLLADVQGEGSALSEGTMIVNARIAMDPGSLREAAERALQSAASRSRATAAVTAIRSFRPGYPRPPYRVQEVVA